MFCMEEIIINAAKKYAKMSGYDSVRPAGKKDGYFYFHVFLKDSIGLKTGLPHIIKIGEAGQILVVKNLSERMWAVKEEVKQL